MNTVAENKIVLPEFSNWIRLFAGGLQDTKTAAFLLAWENIFFSLGIITGISLLAHYASRKRQMIPGRLQSAAEILVEGFVDMVCGILGEKYGRRYLPFLGTLFIYILFMNLAGLIPLLKSPTASLSTAAALSLCVFACVTWTALKELGFAGFIDHLAGKPRGAAAFTVVLPVIMFVLHSISELARPLTLSLRLRSNVWGDDILLALFAGFGIKGFPLLFFNTFLALLSAVVQALVFCLLSTIYLALVINHEADEKTNSVGITHS
jgi:F-type H+-transporting ATPase subunit a